MKRALRFVTMPVILSFAHVCAAYPQASPQQKNESPKAEALPSVDEIAAKCAKGSGGKEAWAKLSTMVMVGTLEFPSMASLTGKVEITAKTPDKVLHILTLADGQFVQKQGFDGRVGWKSDSQNGLKQLEGAELEEAKLEGIFDTDVRLKEVYPDMKVTGRAKVGDRSAYTVLVHLPGGKAQTFYFDAETGLRIAQDSEGPDEKGQMEKTSVFFEDFRTVGGVQIPFRVRFTSASVSFVARIQDVKYNVPVDDSLFAMPAAGSNPGESQPAKDSAEFDAGTFVQDVYTNHFLGIRYEAPAGWTAHGEETKKEIMNAGKSLVDQKAPGGKAIAESAEERTHQLLTLFQYPLGTPGVENQLVQILAEDIRFAPGVRSGREYLLNVQQVLKSMKTMPEFDKEPKEVTYGGRIMHRMDVTTKMPAKTIYQSMIAVVLKGYAVSFAFTSFSPEGRDNLLKTLETLRFADSPGTAQPH